MDLLALTAVAAELRREVAGAVLSRVVQTAPETLVLEWWAGGRGERRLVIAAEPEAPRLHLTALPASAWRELPPPRGGPPRFCAYLRAHAQGARLHDVVQPDGDRVVILRLGRAGEAPARLDLVVELLGSHAQVLAVGDDGRVREALRRAGGTTKRRLAPGDRYVPPPPGGRQPPLASELVERVAAGRIEPRIYRPAESDPVLAMVWLARFEAEPGRVVPGVALEPFDSASAAVEAFYAAPADRLARRAAPLGARLEKARARLLRRLAAIEVDRVHLARGDEFRRLGDLLAAQRHRLRKGQREARLVDLFDPQAPALTVTLDPALDPQGNIEAYYARARKARRGLEAVAARRAETEAELAYLDQALYAVEAAEEPADLAALEAELAEQGLVRSSPPSDTSRRPRLREGPDLGFVGARSNRAGTRVRGGADAGRRGRVEAPPLRRFRSSDGFEIVAGKSNVANDYVSTRLARPEDLWLHAEGYPGAHVLVRRPAGRREVPERTVLEAAALAALYSRARGATKVAVHVAPAASVRKPRGARPGLVALTGPHRTILVAPDPDLPARLSAARPPAEPQPTR